MKYFILLTGLLIIFTNANAQLKANAGNDIMVCYPTSADAKTQLGGNPVASGGVEPYKYTWSGRQIKYNSPDDSVWVYASKFLNDTTVSNPSFKSIDAPEKWTTFYLKVQDAAGNLAYDTIRVIDAFILSGGSYMLPVTIQKGDSVHFFGMNHVFHSNFPLQYSITPTNGLKNPTDFNGWAKPDTTTTYNIRAVNTAGCETQTYYLTVNVEYPNGIKNDLSIESCKCYINKGDLIIHMSQKQSIPYEVTVTTLKGDLIYTGKYRNQDLRLTNIGLKENQLYIVSIIHEKVKQVFKVMAQQKK